jgi:uncharacterized protein (TIGR02453 family)
MQFSGFSKETVKFFAGLEKNNSKTWFEEHRSIYDKHVLPEAQSFVQAMGQKLQSEISENIEAIPKIDKSIFRLHRDVRFSKNKDPYKTHLGIFFWEGQAKKIENPGFYFQLNGREIFYGVGLHIFPPTALAQWRQAVADDTMGTDLERISDKILGKNKTYRLMDKHYKKVPRGFAAGHPRADWLLYNGLAYAYTQKLDETIYQPSFLDFSFQIFKDMSLIHPWLLKMLKIRV